MSDLSPDKRKEIKNARIKTEAIKDPEEEFMERGKITVTEVIEKAEGNHNNPYRVKVRGDNRIIEAVFKPCGENHGINCRCSKERATYLVDRILGFNIVPTTVIREAVDQRFDLDDIGSLQAYDYGEVADNAHLDDNEDSMMILRIFDYITWNYDRHDWNYLVKSDGAIVAIDNESSFGTTDNSWARQEIITDLENVAGKQLPKKIVEIFENFERDPRIRIKLKKNLKELLDNEAIDAAITRLGKIAQFIIKTEKIPIDEHLLRTLEYK